MLRPSALKLQSPADEPPAEWPRSGVKMSGPRLVSDTQGPGASEPGATLCKTATAPAVDSADAKMNHVLDVKREREKLKMLEVYTMPDFFSPRSVTV